VTCCSTSGRLLVCVDLFFNRLWHDSTSFVDSSCYDNTLKMRILDYIFLVLFCLSSNAMLLHTLCICGGVKEYKYWSRSLGVPICLELLSLYSKSYVLYIVAFGLLIIQVAYS
jgi:hypothetical protein